MIPVDVLALFFVSAAADTPVEPPVEVIAPPTSPTTARYGGIPGAVKVTWVAGDVDAVTRIAVDIASSFYPYATVAAGVTTFNSDLRADQSWDFSLTHVKDGQESTAAAVSWTAE